MASESLMDDVQALIRRASNIRDTIQEICDVQLDFTRDAENFHCVLYRLQQELTRDSSPLNRIEDIRRLELKGYCDNCLRNLDEIDHFLTRCKTYHDLQTSILHPKDKIPLSGTDRKILSKLREDFIYYAFHISHLTVKASMESLSEAKELADNAGFMLRYAVNYVTAGLLAKNERPRGDCLWEDVFYTLRRDGFSDAFLKEHRSSILTYVKAIERKTAFEHIREPPVGNKGCGTAQWEAAQEGRYRKSDYDSQSSNNYDDSEDPWRPLSRKRTRSNEENSRQTRRDNRTDDFQPQSSTKPNSKNGFRFSDPLKVFQAFKEKDAKFSDEEILADFLDEKPAHSPNVRDDVREIYRAYDDKYDQRCESLISKRTSQDRKKDVKEYVGLIDEVERQVLDKLDELHLADDTPLRAIRKKIIDKVKKVLEDLEKAKERLER